MRSLLSFAFPVCFSFVSDNELYSALSCFCLSYLWFIRISSSFFTGAAGSAFSAVVQQHRSINCFSIQIVETKFVFQSSFEAYPVVRLFWRVMSNMIRRLVRSNTLKGTRLFSDMGGEGGSSVTYSGGQAYVGQVRRWILYIAMLLRLGNVQNVIPV